MSCTGMSLLVSHDVILCCTGISLLVSRLSEGQLISAVLGFKDGNFPPAGASDYSPDNTPDLKSQYNSQALTVYCKYLQVNTTLPQPKQFTGFLPFVVNNSPTSEHKTTRVKTIELLWSFLYKSTRLLGIFQVQVYVIIFTVDTRSTTWFKSNSLARFFIITYLIRGSTQCQHLR